MSKLRILVFAALLFSLSAQAEVHSMVLPLTALGVGNTGRPALNDATYGWAGMLYDQKTKSTASMTFIEGCVMTANHVFDDVDKFGVYAGYYPKKTEPIAFIDKNNAVRLGKKDKASGDIAIAKLDKPLPRKNKNLPRRQLAKKRLEINPDPKKAEDRVNGDIVSYGQNKTDSTFEDGKTVSVDSGVGARRFAFLQLVGYGDEKDPQVAAGRALSTKGDVLYAIRGPHIGAEGDSGAGLIVGDQLVGVMSKAETYEGLTTVDGEAKRKEGQVFASEVTANHFASVADNHDKIVGALDELECAMNTEIAQLSAGEVNKAVAGMKEPKWEDIPAAKRKEIEELLSERESWPEKTPITAKIVKTTSGYSLVYVSTLGAGLPLKLPAPKKD